MEEYIEKTYIMEEDNITIKLEDTRDDYVEPNALGNIGTINLSPSGALILPDYSTDSELDEIKEKKLLLSFKEIFGEEEYNPLSGEYYQKIKIMIQNGLLTPLGYKQERHGRDFDIIEHLNRKHKH